MIRHAIAIVLCLLLVSCGGGFPIPIPSPPFPIPPPEPATPFVCTAPAVPRGTVVRVPNAQPGRYIAVLLPRAQVEQMRALAAGAQPEPTRTVWAQAEVQAVAARYSALTQVQVLGAMGFVATTTEAGAAQLAADPEVAFVQEDGIKSIPPLRPNTRARDVSAGVVWSLDRIDQRDLPLDGKFCTEGCGDGDGVSVFVVDTGVTDIPDFGGRLSADCFTAHTFGGCRDMHGHGTHVAGTVGGNRFGVAKRVKVIPVRVLNEQGSGSDSQVIQGHQWMIQYTKDHPGKYVANESLGGGASPALDGSVCDATAAGITFAIAAGNDDSDACGASPARVDRALTLGAMDNRDRAADFSNTGQCLDLWAPGVDVESDTPQGGSATFSGTSMASPHAAGVAALCAQRTTGDPVEVVRCVLASATPDTLTGVVGPNLLVYARKE